MANFRLQPQPTPTPVHLHRDDHDDRTTASSSTSITLADLWSSDGTDNITDDDDDDDDDRTSRASSIPWAEETVAENRALWMRIEEMLYGERELPADGPLRDELQLWQQHTPHIRVCGTAALLPYFGRCVDNELPVRSTSSAVAEEVFAIHPMPKRYAPRTATATSMQLPSTSTSASLRPPTREATEMLEHCLRISSSSWSRRPTTTAFRRKRCDVAMRPIDSSGGDEPRIHSVRSDIQRVRYDDLDEDDDADDEHDAVRATLKMPPVFRVQPLRPLTVQRLAPPQSQPRRQKQQQQNWSPLGNAAIRRRTILPPIVNLHPSSESNDAIGVMVPFARRNAPAVLGRHGQRSPMGDLFGRSVSAVYVPSLNI